MTDRPPIDVFKASNGALIYRLPLEVFPQYIAYAHLIIHRGVRTLVDCGSGLEQSNQDLMAGFAALREVIGQDIHLSNVDRLIITHGHIDHFGGVPFVRSQAPDVAIGLHDLARPVLVSYEQRVLHSRNALVRFLRMAGVPDQKHQALIEMYMLGKQPIEAIPIALALHDGDVVEETFRVVHVPGHSPGLVMLQVGDVLLTADHILPHTSVVLAPESITPYTGVGHYLESLKKAAALEGVRVALGGHEPPIPDFYEVVRRTRDGAIEKVERVRELCAQPRTIYEIACAVYDVMDGYGELLKLEQVGARVEYLHQRGWLVVDDLAALKDRDMSALRYRLPPGQGRYGSIARPN